MQVDQPLDGIAVVFGGDTHQILPVVQHGNHSQIVKSCIQVSHLWTKIQKIQLGINMHVAMDEIDLSAYILTIGYGTAGQHPEIGEDMIKVPLEYLVDTLDSLIQRVFPNISDGYSDKYFVVWWAILTPQNDNVDMINEIITERFPGIGKTYLSAGIIGEDDVHHVYPTDFINSLNPSGMPPHAMTLKVGAPVMLLRNLCTGPRNSLRNGTPLIILKLGQKVLEVEIANGVNKRKHFLLPRIT